MDNPEKIVNDSITVQLISLIERIDCLEADWNGKIDAKFQPLLDRIAALQAAGTVSSHSARVIGFVPQEVHIKGWCKFNEREQHGLTPPQANGWFENLVDR